MKKVKFKYMKILFVSVALLFNWALCLYALDFPPGSHKLEDQDSIDISLWLDSAEPLNDDKIFIHGYTPMKANYAGIRNIGREAMRKYGGNKSHVRDLFTEESLELEGFSLNKGSGTTIQDFLHGVKKRTDEDLTITWTSPGELVPLIFIALEDIGTSGEESVSLYKNDKHLGTYYLGNRNSLKYPYPYNMRKAREAGDIAMVDPINRTKQIGVLLRQRQFFSQGDKLRVIAGEPGTYRVSALMIVPRSHSVNIAGHEILFPEVKVWRSGRQPGNRTGNIQFAWVTHMPSKSILLWSNSREDIEAGRGNLFYDNVYRDNHQYYAGTKAEAGKDIYYRLLAESNDGRRTATQVMSYTRPALPPQTASGRIEIHPVDTVNVEGTPAYGSVPLNRGEVFDMDSLRIVRLPDNRPVPAQFRAVAYHNDESVRWLGVDFSAAPSTLYALEYDPGIGPAAAEEDPSQTPNRNLTTGYEGEDLIVSGSLFKAVFNADAPGGLASLETFTPGTPLLYTPENMRLYMTDPEGSRFFAGSPEKIEIEDSGPLRVTVLTEGYFTSGAGKPLMRYIIRWQMYKDSPGIGMELTVGNDRDEDEYAAFPPTGKPDSRNYAYDKPLNWYFVNIRDLYLELDMDGDGKISVGMNKELKDINAEKIRLFQRDENTVINESDSNLTARFTEVPHPALRTAIVEETELSSEARMDGRFLWTSGDKSVGIRFDRFWQNYPKSYEFSDNTLKIGIMPSYSGSYYPPHRLDSKTNSFPAWSDTSRLFFYLRQGMYRFMYGKQKTHNISLFFGDEAKERVSAEHVIPPAAFFMPPPGYKCDTFAVGDFLRIKEDGGQYPAINDWMDKFYEIHLESRGYGMLNFGDSWGERGRNWQNLQSDFAQSASKEFWRTGSRGWLSLAYETAMHFADIDTVNYGPNRGCQTVHSACHTGNEYLRQEGIRIEGDWNNMNAGHMRIGGIRNVALITGSGKLRENVEQFAEYFSHSSSFLHATAHVRGYSTGKGFKCYEMESNPFDLNAARIAFERAFIDADPYTSEYTSLPLGYKEVTGDERVDYIMAVRTLYPGWNTTWDEHLKLNFRGITIPGRSIYTHPRGLGAEAYLITGDPLYRKMLEESTIYGGWDRPIPGAAEGVEFLGERGSTRCLPISTIPYYLNAAGIKNFEPKTLPEETIEVLKDWKESSRIEWLLRMVDTD